MRCSWRRSQVRSPDHWHLTSNWASNRLVKAPLSGITISWPIVRQTRHLPWRWCRSAILTHQQRQKASTWNSQTPLTYWNNIKPSTDSTNAWRKTTKTRLKAWKSATGASPTSTRLRINVKPDETRRGRIWVIWSRLGTFKSSKRRKTGVMGFCWPLPSRAMVLRSWVRCQARSSGGASPNLKGTRKWSSMTSLIALTSRNWSMSWWGRSKSTSRLRNWRRKERRAPQLCPRLCSHTSNRPLTWQHHSNDLSNENDFEKKTLS